MMDLVEICYISTISTNLVSLFKIDELGYYFTFCNDKLNIVYDSIKASSVILYDGLYIINLNIKFINTLVILKSNVGLKHSSDEKSFILWYRDFGYIFNN